ncbi:MAG: DUF401 family protein [Desulfosudaceae bacterium]
MTLPALLKIAVIFTAIIFAIRHKISLATAFLAGALLLAFFFGLSPKNTVLAVIDCLTHPQTVTLCVIIALILIFSNSLEQSGQLRRLLSSFRGLVRNPKLNLAVFPALIGLLPMPGGAVFSAPMVREMGEKTNIPPATLSYINYWFRHIWEYWWPMYPGVLLATLLADINLARFIGLMIPFTLVVMQLGWLTVDKSHLRAPKDEALSGGPVLPFVREIAPILVVILFGIALGWLLSLRFPELTVTKELGLIISLLAGNLLVWRSNDLPLSRVGGILKTPGILQMVLMVAAILLFKQILEDSGAVDAICSELLSLRIPLLIICAALPFIIGVLTGITIAFVGSTFPILISLLTAQHSGQDMIPYIMLALTCGFTGVLVSPVHLCLLVSNQYFGTSLAPVYRHLWLPCACLAACAFGYFFLLNPLLN